MEVLLVVQGSTNRTHTIAVVPEIITLTLLANIYICFQIVCVCFIVSTVQHPNSRTIRWNTTTQWIPLFKLDATGQMLRPEGFGLCLGIEAYPITKSILKWHFMPETFVSIDNNLQRRVRLHNIDKLSHDTAFWNIHFYMPKLISEEILGFVMWYQCLYYSYSLLQHMTFSDLQPKLK